MVVGRSHTEVGEEARLRHRYTKDGLTKMELDAYANCAWLQERDQLGLLRPYFTPPLSEEEQERARLEETARQEAERARQRAAEEAKKKLRGLFGG